MIGLDIRPHTIRFLWDFTLLAVKWRLRRHFLVYPNCWRCPDWWRRRRCPWCRRPSRRSAAWPGCRCRGWSICARPAGRSSVWCGSPPPVSTGWRFCWPPPEHNVGWPRSFAVSFQLATTRHLSRSWIPVKVSRPHNRWQVTWEQQYRIISWIMLGHRYRNPPQISLANSFWEMNDNATKKLVSRGRVGSPFWGACAWTAWLRRRRRCTTWSAWSRSRCWRCWPSAGSAPGCPWSAARTADSVRSAASASSAPSVWPLLQQTTENQPCLPKKFTLVRNVFSRISSYKKS